MRFAFGLIRLPRPQGCPDGPKNNESKQADTQKSNVRSLVAQAAVIRAREVLAGPARVVAYASVTHAGRRLRLSKGTPTGIRHRARVGQLLVPAHRGHKNVAHRHHIE
jgi:hypothetical protein